jgi:hypothetical protein
MSLPKCMLTTDLHTHRRDPLLERTTRRLKRESASRCRGGCSALIVGFRLLIAQENRGLPLDSSRLVVPLKHEKNLPRYGAQHRQDALWEGERARCETN